MKNPLLIAQKAKITELQQKLELEQLKEFLIEELWNKIDFEKINKTFQKLGLEPIRDFNVHMCMSEMITKENLEEYPLIIDYRVKSTGSLKGIPFAGFTKSGSGKNSDRLVKKANELEDKITKLCGYKCSINHYGLEIKRIGEELNFSIQFYITKEKPSCV